MTTNKELRRLVEAAIKRGDLPRSPVVRVATVVMAADTACSVCGSSLGVAPAFEVSAPARTIVVDRQCFSEWLDILGSKGKTAA